MNLSIQKCLQSHIPKNFLECLADLESNVQRGRFTAWSLANNEGCLSSFWADETLLNKNNNVDGQDSLVHPYFDLSSLTKPLFLNLYLRILFNSDFVKVISTPIRDLISSNNCFEENNNLIEFILKNENKYSFNSFLSHFSGAKNWFWMGSALWSQKITSHHLDPNVFYNHIDLKNIDSSKIIQNNLNSFSIRNFQNENFGQYLYSDINYFVLARIIESFFLKKINWNDVLNQINEKLMTRFFHASLEFNKASLCIPYYPYISSYNSEFNDNVKENNFGYINDTNANILSSFGSSKNIVSGHAGFFGNIIDVCGGVNALCKSQNDCLSDTYFIRDKSARFVYGLDTPTDKDTTAGLSNWPKNKDKIFGHLGYSGTAFWFSREKINAKNNFNILLTNRTAQRSKHGVEKCPRIYIYTNFLNGKSTYFQSVGDSLIELTKIELIDTINEYYGISKRIWDQSVIRIQPNINETRRYIANKLWNI